MNDCLSLPIRQSNAGSRPLGDWEGLWQALGEGEAEGLPQGRGEGWQAIAVPAQQAATEGAAALWYRCRFARPDHAGRVLLRFGGAFLATNVWLNGRLMGSHYGYFGPFGFDVTPFLKDENLLVLCCEAPIETDLARKRHVMGLFNDGDDRLYPSSAFFSLPESYRWEVPVGLWRPVELEYLGPVSVDWLRLRPRIEAGDTGRLEIETRLRNLDGRSMSGELLLEVTSPANADAPPVRLRRAIQIAGGTEQAVSISLTVPEALRWWPWRLGAPNLHQLTMRVLVNGEESARLVESFGFSEAVVRAAPDGWSITVNGRPMFLRGAVYAPGLRLDQLTEELLRADLELARAAHLDALRVHAHVLPEAFYRLADEVGMLVFADFPLTLAYAYHASADENRFFETAVREQIPEFVGLLHNRASVILWTVHDDPPWIAANAERADVHAVRQNYTIDQEARALIKSIDPLRGALAASGELDSHLWQGWREGSWSDFADLAPALASAFGAQALPSANSPVWDVLGRRWPITGDDPHWLYHGFQPAPWAERGAGLPTEHDTLQDYIEAGQDYQSHLLSYAVDQLRKRKLEHCWGAFVFQLVDPFPGAGFGLVDSARVPRTALAAVRDAMAPVRVIIDPIAFVPFQPWGVGYRPGQQASVRLVVVNDDPRVSGRAEIRWTVWRENAPQQGVLGRVRDAVRRKTFGGRVAVELPTASEPALQAAVLTLPLEASGDYRLEAELRFPDGGLTRSHLDFRVSDQLSRSRRVPLLPRYLTERLVVADSLHRAPDGLGFTLRNRTRPAVLTSLVPIRLDSRPIPPPRVLVETENARLPLPRRLELPMEREVRFLVELEDVAEVGDHTLEIEISLPGLASGRVLLGGTVRAEDFRPPPTPT
ncbi:MAG: glycoside hydrolase family 2 protein [Candidatus Dormibacteraceae bacterium]